MDAAGRGVVDDIVRTAAETSRAARSLLAKPDGIN
jgi:hypothetical protein